MKSGEDLTTLREKLWLTTMTNSADMSGPYHGEKKGKLLDLNFQTSAHPAR